MRIRNFWKYFVKQEQQNHASFPHLHSKPKHMFSSLRDVTAWDLFKVMGTACLAGVITLWVNESAAQLEKKRYHQGLVREYIDSVKVLLLDKYHHEEYIKPEILPEDVEDFVKSKTATTIKALKDSPEQRERLINFLRRVEVGFAPLKRDFQAMPQNICEQPVTTKNKEYSHFLCGINLDGVDLRKAQLLTGILQDAKLHEAKLIETNLDHSRLQNAFLQNAKMQKASLIQANLTDAVLTDAVLTGADLTKANLRGADLRRAKLTGAELTGADLRKANLRGAKLKRIKLDKTKLEGALFDSSTELPFGKEKAKEYKMLEISRDVKLRGADLTGADLTGADLRKADLRGANLKRIEFNSQTKLEGALFDSSTELPFDNEKVEQEYKMLEIPKADLTGADLTGADLTGADLTGADLTDANFTNAKITNAQLALAKLCRTIKNEEEILNKYCELYLIPTFPPR